MGEIRKHQPKTTPAECFTITEFCDAHRISRKLYYEIRKEGRGPLEMHTSNKLGGKVLITKEEAARWRAQRDAEARQQASSRDSERRYAEWPEGETPAPERERGGNA